MTTETMPATGTYTLDPERTTIRCHCKAMGLLTVHGTFRLNAGQVSIADDLAKCEVNASIAAGSFESGNRKRDADVASAALLDARTYPEITFTGTGVQAAADGWTVTGSVTAHGTTRPVEVHLTQARPEGDTVRFHATATLDRLSFGITKMKLRVGHTADLIIDAVAVPA